MWKLVVVVFSFFVIINCLVLYRCRCFWNCIGDICVIFLKLWNRVDLFIFIVLVRLCICNGLEKWFFSNVIIFDIWLVWWFIKVNFWMCGFNLFINIWYKIFCRISGLIIVMFLGVFSNVISCVMEFSNVWFIWVICKL